MATGLEIYNFIKPNLGRIGFAGETYSDSKSVENLKKYKELIDVLLEDLNVVYNQTEGRNEYSAISINKSVSDILYYIKEQVDECLINEKDV